MTPYKIFIEKFMEEHPDIKPFQSRNMARSQYSQLSDKKKLKYIKKAEKAYDSFEVRTGKLVNLLLKNNY